MRTLMVLVILLASVTAAAAENCIASVYTVRSNGGTQTASGIPFSNSGMTAAHKTLPFRSRVLVTSGNRSVIVTITDRGPYVRGRCIDLSPAAAAAIGLGYSLARVTVSPLGGP